MSISAAYTEHQLMNVWMLPEAQQRQLLRPALAKLYEDQSASESYLTNWTHILRISAVLQVNQNARHDPRMTPRIGHKRFIELCMEAGLPDAMLKVADLHAPAAKSARISALLVWHHVIEMASTTPEKAAVLNGCEARVKLALLRSLSSNLFIQRAQAAACIRQFSWGPWGRNLSNKDIADIIFKCLLYTTAGHQSILDELRQKTLAWQRELMRETEHREDSLSVEEARAYAPLFWSQSRDDALQAAVGLLLGRDSRKGRRDCLDIINYRPQILTHLLTILDVKRTPSHNEETADALAARILAHLLMAPHLWIPELSEPVFPLSRPSSSSHNIDDTAEWNAAMSCWEMFVKQTRWSEILSGKWKKLESQNRANMSSKAPGDASLHVCISGRGVCRACILRIFINLTYAKTSGEFVLPTSVILSLLPVAYEASQKVPSEERATRFKRHANDVLARDAWTRMERLTGEFATPSKASFGRRCLACFILPPEYILGPVLLFRILRRVCESFNGDVTSWASLPQHTLPDTHLGQIQQIASPENVGIVLRNVALKRLPIEKDQGTQRLRRKLEESEGKIEADFARAAYISAAELAVVVDRFYASAGHGKEAWKDLVALVKKEMVACLGNAAEMSARLGEWHHAWWYATHALASLDGVDEAAAKRCGWDPYAIRAKNQRRVTTAESNLVTGKQL